MASLEVKSWKRPDGTQCAADNYTVHFSFDKRHYRLPGFSTDAKGKTLSEELGRYAVQLLQRKGHGIPLDLRRYVETLRSDIRASMGRQGIIDGTVEGKALAEHVADFKAALEAKGNTSAYTAATIRDLLDTFKACGCAKVGNVTTGKLRGYLAGRGKDTPKLDTAGKPALDADGKAIMGRGISARRHNELVTALRGFFAWMTREGRAFDNPAAHLDKLNEATDRRHPRRAMEPAEVSRLLAAAAFKMPSRFMTLKAFYADLAAAGIPRKDAEGRAVDFHALRHAFITHLVQS